MTTIGMLSSYPGLPFTDWLWNQSPEACGAWKNIRVAATDPAPDYLLLYHYVPAHVARPPQGLRARLLAGTPPPFADVARGVPKERRLFLNREPPLPEHVDLSTRIYSWAEAHCAYATGASDGAPTPDYMPAIWYIRESFRELDELGVPRKTGDCSWVTSAIARSAGHRRRLAFLDKLRHSCAFDLYGRGLGPRGGRGEIANKGHALMPFRYTIAVENFWDNEWYVSEKLWDALLAWCLPLYFGGTAADRLLPEGSFLRIPSLDEEGIRFVKETIASPAAWQRALPRIAEARKIILHELNLLAWLSRRVGKS